MYSISLFVSDLLVSLLVAVISVICWFICLLLFQALPRDSERLSRTERAMADCAHPTCGSQNPVLKVAATGGKCQTGAIVNPG